MTVNCTTRWISSGFRKNETMVKIKIRSGPTRTSPNWPDSGLAQQTRDQLGCHSTDSGMIWVMQYVCVCACAHVCVCACRCECAWTCVSHVRVHVKITILDTKLYVIHIFIHNFKMVYMYTYGWFNWFLSIFTLVICLLWYRFARIKHEL